MPDDLHLTIDGQPVTVPEGAATDVVLEKAIELLTGAQT